MLLAKFHRELDILPSLEDALREAQELIEDLKVDKEHGYRFLDVRHRCRRLRWELKDFEEGCRDVRERLGDLCRLTAGNKFDAIQRDIESVKEICDNSLGAVRKLEEIWRDIEISSEIDSMEFGVCASSESVGSPAATKDGNMADSEAEQQRQRSLIPVRKRNRWRKNRDCSMALKFGKRKQPRRQNCRRRPVAPKLKGVTRRKNQRAVPVQAKDSRKENGKSHRQMKMANFAESDPRNQPTDSTKFGVNPMVLNIAALVHGFRTWKKIQNFGIWNSWRWQLTGGIGTLFPCFGRPPECRESL